MGNAVVGSSFGMFQLHGFDDVTVFQLTVKEPGFYTVFARAVIANDDGDAQNATVRLTHDNGAFLIDQADFRLPGGASYPVAIQGTLRVDPHVPKALQLRCTTFRGSATHFSVFAIQVDQLLFD